MDSKEEVKKRNGKTIDEQQKRQLEYKHFDLRKIKMQKKGADVDHHEGGADAGIVTKIGETAPHPDLQTALDELKPFMARRLGLLEGIDIATEMAKGDLHALKPVLEKRKEIQNRCNVNGLTFVGSGDKYGVMITGSILLPINGSVGLGVKQITFGSDVLGYEEEVEEICERIKKEVYAYRFQNKKAQLDIEFEAEKIEAENEQKEPKKGKANPKADLT